jgi:uncharacterized membrane protein YkoI
LKTRTLTAIGTGLLVGFVALAAEKKIQMKDLPAVVQKAVQDQSKGATLKGLTKEVENGKTEYEAELIFYGHGKDISFDPSGKIISVEEDIAVTSLPQAARSAIEKAASAGKLEKVEAVTENGKSFYEATIRKAGKAHEIQVDANGKSMQ